MESQQMMELLLGMKAIQDENAKTMNEKTETYQPKLDADREDSKAMQEKAEAEREIEKEEIIARKDANTKDMLAVKEELRADREQRKAAMEEILAEMDRKASPEMMTATQAKTDVKLKELTETREEMMLSAEEHQEVPNEDAVVIPVRGRKMRHRGRKQAAGRHGESKELNRGDHTI
jgi:hypothetical protein